MEMYKKEIILYGQATQDDCSVLSTSPGRGVPASLNPEQGLTVLHSCPRPQLVIVLIKGR